MHFILTLYYAASVMRGISYNTTSALHGYYAVKASSGETDCSIYPWATVWVIPIWTTYDFFK